MEKTQWSKFQVMAATTAILVTLLGGVIWLTWSASEFRTQVTTDMSWMRTSLATLVARFNELDVLKTQMSTIDKVGTEGLKSTDAKLAVLDQMVKAFRDNGSPVSLQKIEALNARVSTLEQEIAVHTAVNGMKPKQ